MTDVQYNLYQVTELSDDVFNQCYLLVRQLRPLYIASSLGWSKRQKIDEMRGEGMWYLIATKDQQEPSTRGESIGTGVYASGDEAKPQYKESEKIKKQIVKKVLGFASFVLNDADSLNRPCVYLYEMHVSKEVQSQGIGSNLMTKLIELADKHHPKTGQINLTVFDFNKNARKFYQKYGFEIVDLEDQSSHCLELMRHHINMEKTEI